MNPSTPGDQASDRMLETLSAYLDNELTPPEMAAIKQRLAKDLHLRRLLDDLRHIVAMVRELPRHPAPTSIIEDVRLQLERADILSDAAAPLQRSFGRRLVNLRRLGIAAALMMAATISWWTMQPRDPLAPKRFAAKESQRVASAPIEPEGMIAFRIDDRGMGRMDDARKDSPQQGSADFELRFSANTSRVHADFVRDLLSGDVVVQKERDLSELNSNLAYNEQNIDATAKHRSRGDELHSSPSNMQNPWEIASNDVGRMAESFRESIRVSLRIGDEETSGWDAVSQKLRQGAQQSRESMPGHPSVKSLSTSKAKASSRAAIENTMFHVKQTQGSEFEDSAKIEQQGDRAARKQRAPDSKENVLSGLLEVFGIRGVWRGDAVRANPADSFVGPPTPDFIVEPERFGGGRDVARSQSLVDRMKDQAKSRIKQSEDRDSPPKNAVAPEESEASGEARRGARFGVYLIEIRRESTTPNS